jgi:hypothetical protein
MLAPVPQPAIEGVTETDDTGLPQAESLAADDVAKARAEQEAKATMAAQAPSAPDVPVVTKPQPPKDPEASATKPQEPEGDHKSKHKRKRSSHTERPAERVESAEEAEHNKPTEAGQEQGALTGKLILPTAEKPKPEPVQPKLEKPKKLAPGEVFVDEHGNVMTGD